MAGISQHIDRSAIALYLLQNPIRKLFSNPHPSINPANSRALSRPAGGADAHLDFHDTAHQPFKSPTAWGCYNVLSWAIDQLSDDMLEPKIGLILPPTLTLMDDFEPAWRGRGCSILQRWMDRFPTEIMKRMGLDRLLLDSAIHTLSLHANPPLPHVLPLALKLISKTTEGIKRAERLSEIMDKSLVRGWSYAPPGLEGRPVLINIAHQLDLMCEVMGTGIARWLKVSLTKYSSRLADHTVYRSSFIRPPSVYTHTCRRTASFGESISLSNGPEDDRVNRSYNKMERSDPPCLRHTSGQSARSRLGRGERRYGMAIATTSSARRNLLAARPTVPGCTTCEHPFVLQITLAHWQDEYSELIKTDKSVFGPLVPA